MAQNKEISIIIRAKNAMAAGLSKAKASMQAFGKSALNIGKFFAKAFLGAGAAVAGFAAKAISAYAVQEAAERSLVAAMNAHGEAGDALLPGLKKIAAAIQDETGAADEATLAGMAKMRMLGVQTSEMEKAAKGVIALKSVGLEEAAAQKAVAMALQGNYQMLTKYIPELKTATSETEKAQLVNDMLAKGYEQQAAQLDTVSGQWGALKGRVGDFMEEVGRAISGNDELMNAMKRAGDAIKATTQALSDWIDSGGVVKFLSIFKQWGADVEYNFGKAKNAVDLFFSGITGQKDAILKEAAALDKKYAERSAQIASDAAKQIEDASERRAKASTTLAESEQSDIKRTEKVAQDAANRRKQAIEEVARMRVKELLDKRKADKETTKETIKEDEKARRMEDRMGRGARLGKKQEDWLKAYTDIRAARKGLLSTGVAGEGFGFEQEAAGVQQDIADNTEDIKDMLHDAITY